MQLSATTCDLRSRTAIPKAAPFSMPRGGHSNAPTSVPLKVRQVLAASSPSASNFYRRFPSNAHLLLALLKGEFQLVESRRRDRIDTDAPFAEQLETWLRYNIGILYHHRRAQRALMFLIRPCWSFYRNRSSRSTKTGDRYLSEIIQRGMNKGELFDGDPLQAAMFIGNLIRGFLAGGSAGQSVEDDLVVRMHDFVLRVFGPHGIQNYGFRLPK
ncbi:hypothetical protein GON09_005424 [Rhodococcus sp. B50]|nr:hypothetical protein [Rhodococcus sp. B50]